MTTLQRHHPKKTSMAGFTLVEALIAMALMGLTLAALGTVTAQWLPNWNHGLARIQRDEQVALGLERIVADLAAAEFVPASRQTRQPFFEGAVRSITFVRIGIGPNTGPGLEFVRIAEDTKEAGVVRTRAPFVPLNLNSIKRGQPNFSDPVVLLKTPYQLSFSYAGIDRAWRDNWQSQPSLPEAIKLTLRDAATLQILSVSTATSLHSRVSMECIAAKSLADCLAAQTQPPESDERKSRS